jgi:DnaA-homolog protein
MQQIPLPMGLDPEPSLDDFVPGENGAALAALAALAEGLPAASAASVALPPVYLWGPAGCGKTHLLRALARRVAAAGTPAPVFDAATALPWEPPTSCRLLLIDDCERLDAARQQAAFALFVEAAGAGIQIVAAGRLPPVDLPLRDDLRTRLGWGPVYALQPLSDAQTRAALQHEARRRGITLPDEVLQHLQTHCPRDLGSLMAVLDGLDHFSLARGRRVTLPLLREWLAGGADGVGGRGDTAPTAGSAAAAAPPQTLHPA